MKDIDKIHLLELGIALEVKRICEKNKIPYFLTAGTLLGAVRHGGFIPWDDDMDIGMLREDYERFILACKSDLGEQFYLQTWDTDKNYPFSYGKIRLKRTRVVEAFAQNNQSENNGIFIDIFPFDNAPDSLFEQNIQAIKYYVCRRILWIKKEMGMDMKKGTLKQRVKYYLFKFFSALLPYSAVKKYFSRVQLKYNHINTKKVVTDGAYGYRKEMLNANWIHHLEPILFEKELFLSYAEKEAYLEYFYGDYMKLPPENKRGGHSFLLVDFGPY